jgi:hypothetical protein
VYLFGAWALLTGLLGAAVALRLTGVVPGAGLLGVGGVLSVVLGVLLLRSPDAGALLFARLFGAYQLAAGVVLLTLAVRLHHVSRLARVDRIGGVRAGGRGRAAPPGPRPPRGPAVTTCETPVPGRGGYRAGFSVR